MCKGGITFGEDDSHYVKSNTWDTWFSLCKGYNPFGEGGLQCVRDRTLLGMVTSIAFVWVAFHVKCVTLIGKLGGCVNDRTLLGRVASLV